MEDFLFPHSLGNALLSSRQSLPRQDSSTEMYEVTLIPEGGCDDNILRYCRLQSVTTMKRGLLSRKSG